MSFSFYGEVSKVAEISGCDISDVIIPFQEFTNEYINAAIKHEGFGATKQYEEVFFHTNNKITILSHYPVVSVNRFVSAYNHETQTGTDIDAKDYTLDKKIGIIEFNFRRCETPICIEYNAGYDYVPSDIKTFATFFCARQVELYKKLGQIGVVKSVKIGDYSETFDQETKSIVSKYDNEILRLTALLRGRYG
jgi:hypothetical protein